MKRLWLSTFGLVALLLTPALADAAPSCSSVTPALGETVTCTYSAGGSTTIALPTGAGSINVDLSGGGGQGGGGSTGSGGAGGTGAKVVATLDVTDLASLTVAIGAGGADGPSDGHGGGFSAVYAGSVAMSSAVIAVAGGGGGGGSMGSLRVGGSGASAGTAAGGDGVPEAAYPGAYGRGGRDGIGGSAGSFGGCDSTAGLSWILGGTGGTSPTCSGGYGGAGYGGGGAGGPSGGGAGGSYVDDARSLASSTYTASGGGGGEGRMGVGQPGENGSITITVVARTLAVTYDPNGADSGSVPTAGASAYGGSVTVAGNTSGLARTGYAFADWNTARDGSGTRYGAGSTIASITSDVTLYAQWVSTASPETPTTGEGSVSPTPPGAPRRITWSRNGTRITARFAIARGTRYAIRATRPKGRAVRGRCVVRAGKARCAITLRTAGTWRLTVTPTRDGVTGTPARKRIRIPVAANRQLARH